MLKLRMQDIDIVLEKQMTKSRIYRKGKIHFKAKEMKETAGRTDFTDNSLH